MKRIVMVLVFVLILSISVTAFAAGSPVVGSTEVSSSNGGAAIQATNASPTAEMKAVVESKPELKAAKSVLCEEMTVVDKDGKAVEGKATVSVAVKGVKADSKVYVIVYKDGKAELVEAKVVDGKVVFEADFPCTVEILVDSAAGEEAPKTGVAALFAWLF